MSNHDQLETLAQRAGIINQTLVSKYLDLGMLAEAKQLFAEDISLKQVFESKSKLFDFAAQIEHGTTLFVGEGNLSFSLCLANMNGINLHLITATTIETGEQLSTETIENARSLKKSGARVLHGIDATKLSQSFGGDKFDSIVFQFPHTGTREPVEDKNPNFILVRDFLRSAKRQLNAQGKIIISAVDNPHYRGAFQLEEAAQIAGFRQPEIYRFDPFSFSGYTHSMTLEDDSAIDTHKDFATWVFRL